MLNRLDRLESVKDQVKQRLVDYLLLQGIQVKENRKLRCINPAHDDKNPSAGIFDTSSGPMFHCFSCGLLADTLTASTILENRPASGPGWVQDTLFYLANALGIPVPEIEMTEEEKYEVDCYRAYNDAAGIVISGQYSQWTTTKLQLYGWSTELCRDLGIGGVLSFEDYRDRMIKTFGHSADLLKSIDLLDTRIFNPDNLIYTIKDERGRPVGFAARNLMFEEQEEEWEKAVKEFGRNSFQVSQMRAPAKFINSVQSGKTPNPIYRKGSRLFGLHRAIAKKHTPLYVFEGYSDATTALHHGLQGAVAIGTTSLTEDHVELILRHKIRHIIFVLDADDAGQQATKRNVKKIEEFFGGRPGIRVQIIDLPEGCDDPDAMIRTRGIQSFLDLPRKDLFQWKLEQSQSSGQDSMALAEQAIPLILGEPSPIRQNAYVQQLEKLTSIPAQKIWEELRLREDEEASRNQQELLNIGTRLAKALQANPQNVHQLLATYSPQVETVSEQIGKAVNAQVLSEYIQDTYQEWEDPNRVTMFKTGWPVFDERFGGIPRTTAYIAVPGKPNQGKSTFLCNVAHAVLANNSEPMVLYHSVDDHLKKLMARFISSRYNLPTRLLEESGKMLQVPNFKVRNLDGMMVPFRDLYEEAKSWFLRLVSDERLVPVDINLVGPTVPALERQLKRIRKAYPTTPIIVVMDNFHLYEDTTGREGEASIRQLSIACKRLVNSYEATILATMELPKASLQPGVRPRMANMKGSAGMAYDANVNIGVYNDLKDMQHNAALVWTDPDDKVFRDGVIEIPRKPVVELIFDKNKITSFDGTVYFKMYPESGHMIEEPPAKQLEWGKKSVDQQDNLNAKRTFQPPEKSSKVSFGVGALPTMPGSNLNGKEKTEPPPAAPPSPSSDPASYTHVI